jgi:hypothetical protein
VVRNSSGVYTVNWSTPFADANYVVTGACQRSDTPASVMFQIGRGQVTYPFTTTSAVVGCGNYDGNSLVNTAVITVMAMGAQ